VVVSSGQPHFASPRSTGVLNCPDQILRLFLAAKSRPCTLQAHPWPPMLYELAHIAPLLDLSSTIAEGGSQSLVVVDCLQDLSQARDRWGAQADGFLTLFTHKLVLAGLADLATLKAILAIAGEVDVNVNVNVRSNTVSRGFHQRVRVGRSGALRWRTRRAATPLGGVAPGCSTFHG
jgi:hypothetical protein